MREKRPYVLMQMSSPHLSSLFSTSAYIGIGLAYKLYQRLLCFLRAKPVSNEQLSDLFHIDVLHHILAQIPLQKRLQTARQVNRQWAEAVAQQCSTQRELALLIGPNNEWADFKNSLYSKTFLSYAVENAVNDSPKLNVDQLTEQVTSFLISTFPRLKTLTLLTGNSEAFQAHFPQLAASINSLSKLECLSLIDNDSEKLTIPSFDFPLLRSLKGLEFYVECSSTDLLQNWEPHLSAQKHNLMRINMNFVAVVFFSDDVTNRPDSIDKAAGCADCGWRLEYDSEEPEPLTDHAIDVD
ncbi:hypothetical protein TYRP_003628 [Tyrophagus putrescentiae]|nr:hypothetical protein TYRP_003628 [Tyrophagus putrescentiae]